MRDWAEFRYQLNRINDELSDWWLRQSFLRKFLYSFLLSLLWGGCVLGLGGNKIDDFLRGLGYQRLGWFAIGTISFWIFTGLVADRIKHFSVFRVNAVLDKLTGLHNRYFMSIELPRMVAKARRHKEDMWVCFVDLNDLKKTNDGFSHLVGDAAIQAVANALKGVLREYDLLIRYGGDEFVIWWSTADKKVAETLIGRITEVLNKLDVEINDKPVCSISATVGFYHGSAENENVINELLNMADADMYAKKRKRGGASR